MAVTKIYVFPQYFPPYEIYIRNGIKATHIIYDRRARRICKPRDPISNIFSLTSLVRGGFRDLRFCAGIAYLSIVRDICNNREKIGEGCTEGTTTRRPRLAKYDSGFKPYEIFFPLCRA